jgi:hypothetical protein
VRPATDKKKQKCRRHKAAGRQGVSSSAILHKAAAGAPGKKGSRERGGNRKNGHESMQFTHGLPGLLEDE